MKRALFTRDMIGPAMTPANLLKDVTTQPGNDLADDPRAAALERVLNSSTLATRPRLKEFLKFVGQAALEGKGETLKESLLAIEIFDRDPTRHSGEDNIVRVTARQLRAKLDEYYLVEGSFDPWVISIPKGAYTTVFTERTALSTSAEAVSDTVISARASHWMRSRVSGWVVAGILLAILSGVLLTGNAYQPQAEEQTVLGLIAPSANNRILVVASTSEITGAYRTQMGRYPTLAEYRNLVTAGASDQQEPQLASIRKLARSRLVNMQNVQALMRLASHFEPGVVVARHANQIEGHELADEQVILLGGPYTNPWVQIFEPSLNFQVIETGPKEVVIRNRSPRDGENPEYRATNSRGRTNGYCRVAYVPNLSRRGSVLLIGGLCSSSLGVLPSSLAEPAFLGKIRKRLGVTDRAPVPYFEALLWTAEVVGISANVDLLAARKVAVESLEHSAPVARDHSQPGAQLTDDSLQSTPHPSRIEPI